MKFIVEEDRSVIITRRIAVEADDLEAAIDAASDMQEFEEKTYTDAFDYDYSDSHKATENEWRDATRKLKRIE